MPSLPDQPKDYNVFVNTDDARAAVRMTASALYTFLEEALANRDRETDDEYEFEMFAHDLLGVLIRHADQLSGGETTWDSRQDGEPPYA